MKPRSNWFAHFCFSVLAVGLFVTVLVLAKWRQPPTDTDSREGEPSLPKQMTDKGLPLEELLSDESPWLSPAEKQLYWEGGDYEKALVSALGYLRSVNPAATDPLRAELVRLEKDMQKALARRQ